MEGVGLACLSFMELEQERSDLTPTALRLLRSNPGSCVRFHHVLQAELGLKRMWERGGPAERQLVQQLRLL